MHQDYDFSKSLVSYRAYLRQDPSERRLSDFISIIDGLFPPSSTTSSADDLLLTSLVMTDPKYVAIAYSTHYDANRSRTSLYRHWGTQPDNEAHDQWNATVCNINVKLMYLSSCILILDGRRRTSTPCHDDVPKDVAVECPCSGRPASSHACCSWFHQYSCGQAA